MLMILVINIFTVFVCVMLHYKVLQTLCLMLPILRINHNVKVAVTAIVALGAHVVEIWIFAVFYYLCHYAESLGELDGLFNGSLLDCVYFSFTVYTTLGFGDIQPHGVLRHLVGIESLVGLVLITWTASFLYLEMQRHWNIKE